MEYASFPLEFMKLFYMIFPKGWEKKNQAIFDR